MCEIQKDRCANSVVSQDKMYKSKCRSRYPKKDFGSVHTICKVFRSLIQVEMQPCVFAIWSCFVE